MFLHSNRTLRQILSPSLKAHKKTLALRKLSQLLSAARASTPASQCDPVFTLVLVVTHNLMHMNLGGKHTRLKMGTNIGLGGNKLDLIYRPGDWQQVR